MNSIFVSGWRPAIGWICATACAWNWIGISLINTLTALIGSPANLQTANVEQMLTVLLGLLGLGGFRTFEKVKGVSRDK